MIDLNRVLATKTGQVTTIVVTTLGVASGIGFLVDKFYVDLFSLMVVPKSGDSAVPLSAGSYGLNYILTYVLISGCMAFVLLVIWEILLLRELRRLSLRRAEDVVDEYGRTTDSIKRVVRQLYNPANPTEDPAPRFNFKEINCSFVINEKGDATVTQDYVIETADDPGHFWYVKLSGDSYAAKFDTLRNIRFRAESKSSNCAVEVLPTNTRGDRKEAAVFFLPEVPPHSARAFSISYIWKGWFGELFHPSGPKITDWKWSYKAQNPNDTAKVTFTFVFDRLCGQIGCEPMHTKIEGETLNPSINDGATTWTYSHDKAPVGRLNWDLKFSRER